ncbi:MAG: S41 family peptidase [Patescibacteria group bacterium]
MTNNYFVNKSKIIIAFLVVIIFFLGIYVGRVNTNVNYGLSLNENLPVSRDDFNIFWDVWRFIEKNYAERKDLNKKTMIYGATSGLINSLKDPYSVFLEPKNSQRFQEDVNGKFEGIGAEIGIRDEVLTVIAPLKNTPAEKAGLKAGDKIIKIGDIITTDLTIDEAVNLIRGPGGTKIILTIVNNGTINTREVSIMRDTISIPITNLDFVTKNNLKIAYLSLYHFTATASQEFRDRANEIIKNKADAIILDLRNNPGGFLEVANELTSYFLEKDAIIAIEDFGNKKQEYRSLGMNILGNLPTVILVNQGSASASEIMAGALRDNKSIKLIGETTFGKGSVQELQELSGGASVKLTIAKWLTPNGISINKEGLKPDFEVKLNEEDFKNNKDTQLDKAIEVLLEEMRTK